MLILRVRFSPFKSTNPPDWSRTLKLMLLIVPFTDKGKYTGKGIVLDKLLPAGLLGVNKCKDVL